MTKPLSQRLFDEALLARARVYEAGSATPLQEIFSKGAGYRIYVKREDLGPINAYKWRGAYNAVKSYYEKTGCQTVVAASAGNHAQGVALAAKKLDIQAKIFMPLSAPQMKQDAVRRHGGENVEVILFGDTYNEAAAKAKEYVEQHDLTYIHPFDDIYTMAGQATIADEIIFSGKGPFDYAFLQIGGGGMAGAVSALLKKHYPSIKIIGVEGVDQASMKASIEAGKPVTLDHVDTFCDGTAVTRPGDLTFETCRENIDEFITVTNEEVSASMERLWDANRVIPEPSGAMGLAGLIKYAEANKTDVQGKKLLSVLCGANMDFGKISQIAQRSAIGSHRRRYLRFHINEEKGGMLALLEDHFKDLNVSDFLYGKTNEQDAWPIIGLEASPDRMARLDGKLLSAKVAFEDVTLDPDVKYGIINYNPALFKDPVLMEIEFPERKGALRDLLRRVSGAANVCYFKYTYSGETVGRAIMGFEFEAHDHKQEFYRQIQESVVTCKPLQLNVAERILKY